MLQLLEGVSIALDSLRAHRGRASLTILGVAIGVAVVMAIAALITGINHAVTEMVEELGPRTFFVFRHFQAGITVSDGSDETSPWRRRPPLSVEEAERLAQLPSLALVVLGEDGRAAVDGGGETLSAAQVQARGPRWPEVSGGDIFPGRSFTRAEYAAQARVAVVNTKLASEAFGRLDPVGQRLKIAGVPFEVIGVYEPPPDLFGAGERPFAVIPHTTFRKHIPHGRGWMYYFVAPADSVTVRDAIDDVTGVLRSMRGLRPGSDNTFDVVTQDRLLESWNQMTGVFFLVMLGLSSIGLVVGGVGVVGIMMISVTERTREIGLRKAIGATKRTILWQFLVEAATLTMVGGAAGMLLGAGVSLIVQRTTPLPAVVPVWSVAAAVAMSVVTGIGFGLFPAVRAARLDPVEALRYE